MSKSQKPQAKAPSGNWMVGKSPSIARSIGELLSFGASPGPYPVARPGESVAKGWIMTGDALRRAITVNRGK